MKSKHYPVVTVLVAALLTILPAVILSMSLNRNSADTEIASGEPKDGFFNEVTEIQGKLDRTSPAAARDLNPPPSPSEFPRSSTTPTTTQRKTSTFEVKPKKVPITLPEVVVANPITGNALTDVPQPVDATELDMAQIEQDQQDALADVSQIDEVVADIGMIEIPTRPNAGASYYEATGHLAMRTQPELPDKVANHSQPTSQDVTKKATAETVDNPSVRTSKSKKRKPKNDDDVSTETVADVINEASRQPIERSAPGNKATPLNDEFMEEVVIQTPLESSPVGRVENVVAMTRARGWPIALIRSDLPDDVWWVQQVVGIQGNSFAARVNFGNEYSLSGSSFDMVIVFLDSPDEVRRFRIAKQFKEIPKGVRHSREFHYIRD